MGSIHPNIFWAQRASKVYVTVRVSDIHNETVNVTEDKLEFAGTGGDNRQYACTINFFGKVNAEVRRWIASVCLGGSACAPVTVCLSLCAFPINLSLSFHYVHVSLPVSASFDLSPGLCFFRSLSTNGDAHSHMIVGQEAVERQ
jgi:hypothetical protein